VSPPTGARLVDSVPLDWTTQMTRPLSGLWTEGA